MEKSGNGEQLVKKTLAIENATVKEITEQIDLVNGGGGQKVYATMWSRISADGIVPARHDAIIFYEVDYRALQYLNKEQVKLPKI